MSNYQIMEIILDAAFFAAVAAIAIIFALIRERVLAKELAGRQAGARSTFPGMLDRVAGSIKEVPEDIGEQRDPQVVSSRPAMSKPHIPVHQKEEKKELSRAEKELIANIAAGKS
jgi:hypothetical protein